jgi:hypothetical protein
MTLHHFALAPTAPTTAPLIFATLVDPLVVFRAARAARAAAHIHKHRIDGDRCSRLLKGLQTPLDTGDRVFKTFEACIYAGQGIVCIALKAFIVGDAHGMTVAMTIARLSPLQITHMIIGI